MGGGACGSGNETNAPPTHVGLGMRLMLLPPMWSRNETNAPPTHVGLGMRLILTPPIFQFISGLLLI